MNGKSETVTYGLKSIVFSEFYIHPSYSQKEYIAPNRVMWTLGINWSVKTEEKWDEVQIFQQLNLFVKENNLNIARLHSINTYCVNKGISFKMKYKLLVELCNNAAAQIQGAWYAKIANPFLACLIPPAHDRVQEIETDFKQMIYENWE